MSYQTIETSGDDGRPIELLLVSYLTNVWCYTTAEESIVYDGNIYIPMPMSRTEISNSGDVAKATITIKVPQDCLVGELFRIQPPSGVVTATIFSKHVDDPEAKAIWKGRIVNAEWEQPWLSLTSDNVFTSLQRTGLRRKYSVQCPHALYGAGEGLCNVNPDSFKRSYPVSSVSGATVTCNGATEKPAGYFAGGFVTWINSLNGTLERAMVTQFSSSGGFTLPAQPRGLVQGQTLTAYPGCDHSLATCASKFNNTANFGGTPFIPKKNPFAGSTLY